MWKEERENEKEEAEKREKREGKGESSCNSSSIVMCVAIICIPITAFHYLVNEWILGTTLCKVTAYMQGVSIVTSVLTIVLMSVDRYLAIRHPMKNRQIFTLSRVRRLVVMTWLTAAAVVFPIALVSQVVTPEFGVQHDYCTEIWPSHVMRQVYDVAFLVWVYLIPGGVIVVLYTLVGFRLWAKDAHLQRQNSIRKQDDVLQVRRRLALMMIILSILFAVCWLPYYICNICLDFEVDTAKQLIDLYPFALLLGHSNSAQNPILYCFMHKGFKNFLLKLIKCQCQKIHWRRKNTLTISHSQNGSLRSPSYKMINRNTQNIIQQSEVILCKDLSAARRAKRGTASFSLNDV
ncbi:neuropeptide ff receptor 2 [Plakobranchus ocellatus]|uniref:Neuropeptide ff receptor 2 n=1 Tax=Plakobranchus ocellatus TaxID=259542 RepID=A0AAV3YRC2_9GAST|nr:neuropeptide ff receptor 2 [Plakobranchus ocellatus]